MPYYRHDEWNEVLRGIRNTFIAQLKEEEETERRSQESELEENASIVPASVRTLPGLSDLKTGPWLKTLPIMGDNMTLVWTGQLQTKEGLKDTALYTSEKPGKLPMFVYR
jgi:hypothetical protein